MPTTAPLPVSIGLTEARREHTPKADPAEIKRNYDYDMQRYLKHSSTHVINADPVALSSFLTSAYHSLEKGLAMEVTKAGFGVQKIRPIMSAILELERSGNANFATRGARGSLKAYVRYHDDRGLPLPAGLEHELRSFVAEMGQEEFPGGALSLNRAQIEAATSFDYDKFIQTRCSLRHYTGNPIAPQKVENAVRQAIKSPRSCNREMRRVHAVYDSKLRDQLLGFHSGNRGFGHKLGAVLIVTVDLREFDMIGERNQGWVDGGLFAMSLVYALHANRLGSCMLNWSEDCEQDKRLREAFDIPDHEVVITFIGVGQMPDIFDVAASPPPDVHDVMSLLRVR